MSRSTCSLVSFEADASIEVASNGQLCQTCAPPEPTARNMSNKARAVAFANAPLGVHVEVPYGGIEFDLDSCDRCFERVLLGLSTKCDTTDDSVDFAVMLERDRYYCLRLKMLANGSESFSMPCEEVEHLTVRLDITSDHVEYLVNGRLVYTSPAVAKVPVFCKVVNIITRNLHAYPRTNQPQQWFMRLPIKNLQWASAVVKVLTLQVTNLGGDDTLVETTCFNLAGDDLARVVTVPGQSIAEVKAVLATELAGDLSLSRLLSADGKVLMDSDTWPLPESKM